MRIEKMFLKKTYFLAIEYAEAFSVKNTSIIAGKILISGDFSVVLRCFVLYWRLIYVIKFVLCETTLKLPHAHAMVFLRSRGG